jgi:hypothetical protein
MSDGLKVILGALGGGPFGMLFALLFWLLLLDLLIAVMVWIFDQTQHR